MIRGAVGDDSPEFDRMRLRRMLSRYFILAFGITWGVGGLGLLIWLGRPDFPFTASNPLYYLAAYGPSIAAILVGLQFEGRPWLVARLRAFVPKVHHIGWYALVLLGGPLLTIAASVMLGSPLPKVAAIGSAFGGLPFMLFKDAGPLGEELGWRGLALPVMLRLWKPLNAAIVLGVIWGFWHLPTFFISTLSQSHLWFPLFVVNSTSLSILMTWLYRRTNGDLALMVLTHLIANFCGPLINVTFPAEVVVEGILAIMIIAAGGLQSPQFRRRRKTALF
jgi:membrane protease YdiL (CAAX protease family)